MKNPKGMGSVYKMKDKKRRKPWRAVSPPLIDSGTTKRYSLGTFETRQDALDALMNFSKNPFNISIKNITFLEIANRWKEEHLPKVSKVRKINIESRLNKMSNLYSLIFSEIKLIDLQSFFNSLTVSSGTKKEYRAVLNLIFDYAIKYDIIDKNPVQFIELGKHEKVRKANIFTQEEISILWKHQLLNGVDTILILIYTGLRIGELLSIKKEQVFIEKRYMIGGSKTAAGKNRLIPLHKDLIPLIKRRLKENQEYLIESKGKNIRYSVYSKDFYGILIKLGIEKRSVHNTRHTFATLINNSGANSTSIKNIIGHSNFAITEKIYIHKDIEELQKAIDMINLKQG